jgi:hypothetical protein
MINWLIYASLIVLIIVNINFSWSKYFKYNYEDNLIVNEIEKNLNDKLINSLAFRQLCKEDEETLILGKWDGTIDGCNCKGNIFIDKCSNERLKDGCEHLYAVAPIKYTVFNSTSICVKRTKLNYREYLKSNQVIEKNKVCPTGYKSCGIIDSFRRKLCIKKEEVCPINSNNIENNIDLFENKTISNDDGRLLTTIKLFEYSPCVFPSEKYWNYYYGLEAKDQRCTTKIKGKLYDVIRYEKLLNFSINKLQLYNDNSITNKLKLDEKSLAQMKIDKIYLFGRPFLGFDTQVIENYDYDTLISKQKSSNKSNVVQIIYDVFFVVLLVVVFVLFCINKLCEGVVKKLMYILWYICLVCFFVSPIFYFIINIIILTCNKKINSILNINSDEDFNELLKSLINDISLNYKYSLAMVVISIIITCSLILILVPICIYEKKKEEKEQQKLDNLKAASKDSVIFVPSKIDDVDDDDLEDNGFGISKFDIAKALIWKIFD